MDREETIKGLESAAFYLDIHGQNKLTEIVLNARDALRGPIPDVLKELEPFAKGLFEAVAYNGHQEMVNAVSDFWRKWDELNEKEKGK